MSDFLLDQEIDRQTKAVGGPIPSLMEEGGPLWFEKTTGNVNEPLLASLLVDKYGLRKSGSRIEDKDGKPVSSDTLKKLIADEIGPFLSRQTAQRVDPLFKLLKIYIPSQKSALKLDAFTAADLAGATIPPTPFIVDQILPCGLTILAAPPKTGKSWLCLALADAVATGSTFWGYPVNAGAVLYLALEDNQARLQSRLRAIGSRMPSNLSMACRTTMCLDSGLIDALSQWISEHGDTRLIILDTLQRVKGAAQMGLDAYAADYARLAPLQQLATEKRVAILAVHHFRKQGNYPTDDVFERLAGSTALFGASDAAWAIYGKRGDDEMNLHITGRDVQDAEYKIRFDKEKSRWQMLGNSEQLEEQRKRDEYNASPLIRTIRELVREAGGRWIGSASALKAETMMRTKTIPAGSDRALFGLLNELQEQLLTIDGIAFTHGKGGREGRDYTFSTVKQTDMGPGR